MKKIILIFMLLLTGTLFFNTAYAQPDDDLLNIKTLQYYEQTSDTNTVLFETKAGSIDNISLFYNDMFTYFNTNDVYFLPAKKGDYVLYNENDVPFKTVVDFDYMEIISTDITFYKNNTIIYSTTLLTVKYIWWEWDGVSYGAEYNNGYQDATNLFNERLEQLKADYESKIDTIKNYYEDQGYDQGYNEGANITENEAYQLGYNDGANDSFQSGIEKWIVPAIIVVLLLGGFIAMNKYKREL